MACTGPKGGLPGVDNLRDCGGLESLVKKHAADGRLYEAACAAPAAVLGPWGLLTGLKATGYPSFMEKLAAYADAVESRVQVDGRLVTCGGPGTSMEFAIALLEQLYGKQKARQIAGPLVMRSNHGAEYTFTELNPTKWTFDHPPKVLVPIANGTEEMEAVMIIDFLRRAEVNVTVASVEDKLDIVASHRVKLQADLLLDEAAKQSYDLIVLPGGSGGAQAFANSETLVSLLQKQRESNKYYGAICASPALVLEPHGLLKGKKATAFPGLSNKLSEQGEVEKRVVVDGNLITSRGPGTALEFALTIVEKLFGRESGLELAKSMGFTSH
ncbi:protein DJ-1 homolog B-like isoform X2 [Prosopis cineraria]|uniref:protein DJ-1 homolog B-like isoform X2 n=1 Tax=Prosopis cineraria TaxID=364024 RepID=UPI0024104DFA|nr:protein DJ-1 homolog B-like isoform X2 [Prosopis cineraria]